MIETIYCPSCQRMLRIPENLLGQSVKCPACEHIFTAPESTSAVPQSSPAPSSPAADDHPSRGPDRRDEDEDYRPSRRRRYEDEEEDDDRRRRPKGPPGKAQAIAIMTLVGGIYATLHSAGILAWLGMFGTITFGLGWFGCLWPGPYFGLVVGILAIIKGAQLLGRDAAYQTPPTAIAVMQIVNIVNCDWINLTLGILTLVFVGDDEVVAYYRGR